MTELPLARGFPQAELADWQALVTEALKGTPANALASRSYDGIEIAPLYARAADGRVIPGRAPGAPWTVMQRIDIADPAAANRQILEDLNNGASGLQLVFEGAAGDYGSSLPATAEAIGRALDDVHFDWGIAVDLDIGPLSKNAALDVAEVVVSRGLEPRNVAIRFGFDPLGAMAASGVALKPWAEIAPTLARLVAELRGKGLSGPFAAADGRPVHAAGGSEAQELAFVLASAVAYLRALEAHGSTLEEARRAIYFRLAADQDQLFTMAKFRALRTLWERIEQACGLSPERATITAETAWRMMTKRDPHGNIVRGTIAALGAALGGADAVTVLPFSTALGVPDAFARRIARNIQSILIEESNLHRVVDPGAGAGAVEALTDQLAARAWEQFQEVERAGGLAEALASGLVQRAVAEVRAERMANVARRKELLIGTSDFPDLHEEPVLVLGPPGEKAAMSTESAQTLMRIRLAEPFERLRDRSDARAARGARPKVFLAHLGRPSDFTARTSFAKSFFEAGGIEAIEGRVEDFTSSGAALACLCSSDKVYATEGAKAAEALAAAGAKHVCLAGKPREGREVMQAAGVGTFLFQGCDALELLNRAYDVVESN